MDCKTWGLALCTWLFLALYFTLKEKCYTILELIYKFIDNLLRFFWLLTNSGVNIKWKGSLFAILIFSSYLYWNLYGNNIIGLTIVKDKMEPFETVAEFLEAGFRDSKNKSVATQCNHLWPGTEDPDCSNGQKRIPNYYVREKLGSLQRGRWNI